MHHHRSACAGDAPAPASASRATAGTAGPQRVHLDRRSRPAARCAARPSPGSGPGPVSTPPRASAQRRVAACDTTSSASRSSRPAHQHDVQSQVTACSPAASPLQQHQLGAEARDPWPAAPPGRRTPAAARPMRVGEHVQHRGRRQVADARPASRQVTSQRLVRQAERHAAPPRAPWDRRGGRPRCACRRSSRSWSARKSSTSSPRCSLDDVGDARRRARSGSRCRRCPSPSPARCPGRSGCGWRRTLRAVAARGVAARRSPTITTAAAPSPNRPLATRLAIDASSRCTVSEHSSTESSTATPSGWPRR